MSTPTGTVTFLFTDVEGSTRLWEESREAMRFALARHDEILRETIGSHNGYIFATGGDAFSAAFQSVSDALESALSAQLALQAEPRAEIDVRVRMALHVGEAEERDGDYFGRTLNRTARVLSTASGSEILVSSAIASVAVELLPQDAHLVDLGERQLKDLERTEHVYRLTGPGLVEPNARQRREEVDDRRPSMAVLPFGVIGGDEQTEALADGLVEDVISALSAIRSFRVIARNSSFVYRGQSVDVREVAADLGVRYVLEGSLRGSVDKIRVVAQLIDGDDGSHIWAESYDGAVEDVFDFQDRITRSITAAIGAAVFDADARHLVSKPVASFDAWDHLVQGMKLVNTVHREEVEKGMGHLNVAIDLDPSLAEAHAMIGLAHFFRGWAHWVEDEQAEYDKAIEWARRATEIDPRNVSAHNTMAITYMFLGQHHRGRNEAQLALKTDPNSVVAHFVVGSADLYSSGDPKAAIMSVNTCLQLDPHGGFAPFYHAIAGASHYLLGEYDQAIAHARDAVAMRGGYVLARVVLATSLARSGAIEDARAELVEIKRHNPDFTTDLINQPFQPQHRADLIEGLRLAGLEE